MTTKSIRIRGLGYLELGVKDVLILVNLETIPLLIKDASVKYIIRPLLSDVYLLSVIY